VRMFFGYRDVSCLVFCNLKSQKLLNSFERPGFCGPDGDTSARGGLFIFVPDFAGHLFHDTNTGGTVSCTSMGIAKSPLVKAFAICERCIRMLSRLSVIRAHVDKERRLGRVGRRSPPDHAPKTRSRERPE
jgi:hypothetical protein